MEQSRLGVFIILLIIIILAPDGTEPASQRDELDAIIAREKVDLETLRNSTFGRPGNLTGIIGSGDGDDGDGGAVAVMIPPEEIREKVAEMRNSAVGEYLKGPGRTEVGIMIARDNIYDSGNSYNKEQGDAECTKENKDGGRKFEKRGTAVLEEKRSHRVLVSDKELPVYHNASGTIHGEWSRLTIPGLPGFKESNVTYDRNITGNWGKITFNIEETPKSGETQKVNVGMRIKNDKWGDTQDVELSGVHFTKTGEMVLTTTSERFAGIFALPHFTLTETSYNLSKTLLLEYLSSVISKEHGSIYGGNPNSNQVPSNPKAPPRCEFIVYLQLHPIESAIPYSPFLSTNPSDDSFRTITPEILHQIEGELRHPTGAPVPPAPPIVLSSIIYSPTCGFTLGTQKSMGIKIESYYTKASNFALSAATVMGIQIWLLIRQMTESNTPSTVSRVSFWTMAMMSVVDGYLTMAFLTVAIFVDSCFLSLICAAFFAFLLVSVFGMRFLITIYRVQRPERRTQATTPPAAPPTPPTPDTTTSLLPAPVSAAPQAPVIIPPNQDTTDTNDDGRQDVGMLYSRFYFVLLGTMFLSLHATSWPPFFRNLFMHTIMILANSYWVPQIYRNVMRGCRKAFTWEFVVGMSVCRLMGVAYVYCWDGNVFAIQPDWRIAAALAGWVWIQVCALASQEIFGPRFLIPSDLLPPAYDYHPILPIDDLEAADPQLVTTSSSSSPPSSSGNKSFDCAICMQSVEVPTISSEHEFGRRAGGGGSGGVGGGGGVGLLGRRNYMVTPCRHVFHSNCLEGWMRFRLQCPICRNPLPPL